MSRMGRAKKVRLLLVKASPGLQWDHCRPVEIRAAQLPTYRCRWVRRMTASVKGCRTPAVVGCLPQARSAGVGQASGEETAGRLGSAERHARAMGIRVSGDGYGAARPRLDGDGVGGWSAQTVVIRGSGRARRQRLAPNGLDRRRGWQRGTVTEREPAAWADRRHVHLLPPAGGGGARGAWPGSKRSMTTMAPPQHGQG